MEHNPHMVFPTPVEGVEALRPYKTAPLPCPVDLHLAGNEGLSPPMALLEALNQHGVSLLRRYPSLKELEAAIAARIGVSPAQVLVTAGADEALDRACRAMLCPGRSIVLPEPTFVMLPQYARLARAEQVRVPWPEGPFPINDTMAAITPQTAAIAVVSPNNPTGAVATAEDLQLLSASAPHAMLMVDLAYTEFADVDLTPHALALPNAVVFRTLSKAWGFAGLRVGYAVGPANMIGWMRATGSPYSVSGPSIALAMAHLAQHDDLVADFIAQIRRERAALEAQLTRLDARPLQSQGNYVYARPPGGSLAFRDALAHHGIGVRAWPGDPVLGDGVRITCPGNAAHFERLQSAIDDVLKHADTGGA